MLFKCDPSDKFCPVSSIACLVQNVFLYSRRPHLGSKRGGGTVDDVPYYCHQDADGGPVCVPSSLAIKLRGGQDTLLSWASHALRLIRGTA